MNEANTAKFVSFLENKIAVLDNLSEETKSETLTMIKQVVNKRMSETVEHFDALYWININRLCQSADEKLNLTLTFYKQITKTSPEYRSLIDSLNSSK